MSYVDLDKVINVSGGGWTIYPDVPYPVLNQRIGIFNKPNAWDTDSNGWFGLLGSSVAGICQENYNFNQQMALAIASGSWAITTRVKSYDFSVDIDKVDGGVIKRALMREWVTSLLSINESTNKITDVKTADVTWNLTIDGTYKRWHIVTSWGNKFLLYWGSVYSLDANNRILSYTHTATYTGKVFAIVWNYVWTIYSYAPGAQTSQAIVYLYSIDNAGITTEINNVVIGHVTENSSSGFNTTIWYQQDNTIAYTAYAVSLDYLYPTSKMWYGSIDLTNTAAVSFTEIYSVQYGYWYPATPDISNNNGMCGYDGTGLLVVCWTDVKRFTAAWLSVSLWTYIWTSSDVVARTSSLALLTAYTNNVWTNTNKIEVGDSTLPWDSIATIYNNVAFIYEPTWVLSQDDSFIWILTNKLALVDDDSIEIDINWTNVETISWNYLYNLTGSLIRTTTVTQISSIAVPSLEVTVDYNNVAWIQSKLWIGITWWDYTTPTLPANNWLSGNATTAWTAGSSASYIDLTLSA